MLRTLVYWGLILVSACLQAEAQSFSSGSTGADGALDLSNCNNTCTVVLPESGILNYTTVLIPPGKGLNFRRNSRNTPVVMLAQGNVVIDGAITVAANSGPPSLGAVTPGPGGFAGGSNGMQAGFGPGGGQPQGDQNGRWVGPLSLVPIVGGSGGAGFSSQGGGGGGGGAIVIASSTSIQVSGSINADSGIASVPGFPTGSGGAIRLVANTLNITGSLRASNPICFPCPAGHLGVIRLEAPPAALTFTGSSSPAAVLSTINPLITPSALPALKIVSVGGFSVPSFSGNRTDTVDLLLPNQLTDPIAVVVEASNIPVGTLITVGFIASQATSTSAPLVGTFQMSSATPTISGLERTGVTYLLATATFTPPESAQTFNPPGINQVARIRVESDLQAGSKLLFLRQDGTRIDPAKLAKAFLNHFGL